MALLPLDLTFLWAAIGSTALGIGVAIAVYKVRREGREGSQSLLARQKLLLDGMRSSLSEGTTGEPLKPLELSGLLRATFSLCQEKMEARGISLEVGPSGPIWIDARRPQLASSLAYLMQHAMEGVERGLTVRVRIGDEGDRAVLILESPSGVSLVLTMPKSRMDRGHQAA